MIRTMAFVSKAVNCSDGTKRYLVASMDEKRLFGVRRLDAAFPLAADPQQATINRQISPTKQKAASSRRTRKKQDHSETHNFPIESFNISTQRSSSATGTNSPVRCATRMSPGPMTTDSAPSAVI